MDDELRVTGYTEKKKIISVGFILRNLVLYITQTLFLISRIAYKSFFKMKPNRLKYCHHNLNTLIYIVAHMKIVCMLIIMYAWKIEAYALVLQ